MPTVTDGQIWVISTYLHHKYFLVVAVHSISAGTDYVSGEELTGIQLKPFLGDCAVGSASSEGHHCAILRGHDLELVTFKCTRNMYKAAIRWFRDESRR